MIWSETRAVDNYECVEKKEISPIGVICHKKDQGYMYMFINILLSQYMLQVLQTLSYLVIPWKVVLEIQYHYLDTYGLVDRFG